MTYQGGHIIQSSQLTNTRIYDRWNISHKGRIGTLGTLCLCDSLITSICKNPNGEKNASNLRRIVVSTGLSMVDEAEEPLLLASAPTFVSIEKRRLPEHVRAKWMTLGKGNAAVPMRYMNEARESQGSREMEWKRGKMWWKRLLLRLVRLSRDLLRVLCLAPSSFSSPFSPFIVTFVQSFVYLSALGTRCLLFIEKFVSVLTLTTKIYRFYEP